MHNASSSTFPMLVIKQAKMRTSTVHASIRNHNGYHKEPRTDSSNEVCTALLAIPFPEEANMKWYSHRAAKKPDRMKHGKNLQCTEFGRENVNSEDDRTDLEGQKLSPALYTCCPVDWTATCCPSLDPVPRPSRPSAAQKLRC